MKNFFAQFDNISIRRKFILVYIFCICLPVIAGGIIWVAFTSQSMQQNTIHYLNQTFEGASSDFSILTQTAVNMANQVNADKSLLNDLSKRFTTPAEHYDLYWSALRNRFNMYLVSNPDIAEVSLYIDDPHFFNTDYFRVLDASTRQKEWYRLASASKSNFLVYPGSTAIAITPYKNRLTIIRKIVSPTYLNNATNYLLIELRLDRVIAKLKDESGNMDIYLTAPGNQVIWSNHSNKNNLTSEPADSYYVLQDDIGPSPYFEGWKITGVYDKFLLYKRQFVVLAYILLITLSLSGFSVFLIWSVLNSMSYRLSALSRHIKKVSEDHLEPLLLPHAGKDEVGWLIETFNKMIEEINDLINVVYKLEMQKKSVEVENIRAEYQYLQAQVDPHFLFNTLNAILVFCVKNGYSELSSIISSLSKLFKRMLVTGNNLISVSEELDFIDKYLAIEKFRFGDKFEYEIQISPTVLESNRLIPKMSIQPIVENACKHGLQASIEDNRRLFVKADIENKALVISVKDNGSGMATETVNAIYSRLKAPVSGTDIHIGSDDDMESGVGIQNVYRRMMMNYGERFHFKIYSAPEQGTEIILRIEEI
ncbi:sensor histidine kinase YehU [Ruminiclostridium hungatei]|uniref:Sensor histidine kinase YehU n=1 Tax=Ruminiclostridium hungatei TaxID=48256 RepID=A0A1V4SJM9_RUMHU|nr:sensor histidine kinase [Ruminiclostridium hungatei]OPX44070.1 sensor histidine kinase YehU [Ruminiclostridium hungatei]